MRSSSDQREPAAESVECINDLTSLERAVREPPLSEWDSLLENDRMASFYQGPAWTLPWYRAYARSFDPLVLVVEANGRLAGVVPLAVHRTSGRLVFAGDGMADYRDVVARPEYRECVVRALLRLCRERSKEAAFRVGPTLPESDTVGTVLRLSRAEHLRAIPRTHFGWRWVSERAKGQPDPLQKRSVRYSLNSLRRMGAVAAEVVRSPEWWQELSDTFFEQHSLRQLYGNRPISFDDPQKQQFFRDMFATSLAHVTVLTVGGRAIAGHFGYRWKGVLYWAAPWFDFRAQQYSPGLLLVLMTMQHAGVWGFSSFDLTEGDGYLKERFSTDSVPLAIVELYARPSAYLRRQTRDYAVTSARRLLRRVGFESVWQPATSVVADVSYLLRTAFRVSPRKTIQYALRTLGGSLHGRLIALRAPDFGRQTQYAVPPGVEMRTNETTDLLKGAADPYSRRELSRTARALSKARESSFHTMLRDGKLVAWGCSRVADDGSSEVQGAAIPPAAAVLHDFGCSAGEEEALALLFRHVLAERRRKAAPEVWLLVPRRDRVTRRAFQSAIGQTSVGMRGPVHPAAAQTD